MRKMDREEYGDEREAGHENAEKGDFNRVGEW